MKKYKYIDSVLSHIKSRGAGKEIENELFDHIDEREKFYSEIGYDDERACEMAESAMGDADVVGEQLDMQHKSKRAFKTLAIIICTILMNVLLSFCESARYLNGDSTMPFPSLWFFVLTVITFCVSLLCLAWSTKRKSPSGLIVGFASGIFPSVTFSGYIANAVWCLLHKTSFALSFYNGSGYSEADNEAVSLLLVLVLLAAFLNGTVIYIKTKRLENTRADITKSKVFVIALSSIIALCLVMTLVVSCKTVAIRNKAYHEAVERSQAISAEFLENINSFMTDDKAKISKALSNTFAEGVYNDDHMRMDDTFDYESYYSVDVDYSDIYSQLEMNIAETLLDPVSTGFDYYYPLGKGDVFGGMKITDAPLPADIYFEYSSKGCSLIFNYNGNHFYDNYSDSYILFTYDEEKRDFVIADSSVLDYDLQSVLSQRQIKALERELLSDYSDDLKIKLDIFDVRTSSQCGNKNVCKVDLKLKIFSTVIDEGVEKIYEQCTNEQVEIILRLDGENVEILRYTVVKK